ncbi:MAG: archaellin/type IV pilin N-terminal domain-containing protein [Nanoarchaeota archaeon]|nr:archaellin/type IV pilin N-terminal domain-containing protein [Nanoarchaeota archaeon]
MKFCIKKKGLSPLIATVFMILLVVVLAALIFLWARGFVGEQIEKFGKPIEELCSSVDFSVAAIDNGGYHILEIVNRGNVNISAFEIKMYSDGNSEISKINVGVPAGKSVSSEVFLNVMGSGESPEKIEIFPVLSGEVKGRLSRKSFVCVNEPFLLRDF